MGGINVQRVLLGGVAAGLLIWVLEGIGSFLYMDQMAATLAAHDLSMDFTATMVVLSVLISLLVGLILVFFYAAARPRFGAGPRTAIIISVAVFVGSYLVTLMGYGMMALFPSGLLFLWGVLGLVELVLAGLLGAWLYRE